MGTTPHLEHDLRYDRADEFMEVVLGHWDAWEDGSLLIDKSVGPLRRSDQGASGSTIAASILQVARAVHRAALAAGPSRHHPGRRQRPRPALRRALGRGDLRRRAHLAGAQGKAMTRSKGEAANAPAAIPTRCSSATSLTPVSGATKVGGRGQDGADRKAAAGDRRAVAVVGGAELRFRLQGHRRAADHGGARRACRASSASATAC